MARIQIRFGGSNRKYDKQYAKLSKFANTFPTRTGIGSKYYHLIIEDTPESRQAVKDCGASISKDQPKWLNDYK